MLPNFHPTLDQSVASRKGGDLTVKLMQEEARESTSPQYSVCHSLPRTLLLPACLPSDILPLTLCVLPLALPRCC